MKAGMVVHIRLNPVDCQHVLDIMGVLNIDPYDGRSFAQCVSLALSALIGMAYKNGAIPEEVDGFQYLNRMAPFLQAKNDKRKYAAANALFNRQDQAGRAGLAMPTQEVKHPGQYVPDHLQGVQGWTESGPVQSANVPLQMDEETKRMLIEEMGMLDDRRNNGEKLTEEERERYRYLNDKLFT